MVAGLAMLAVPCTSSLSRYNCYAQIISPPIFTSSRKLQASFPQSPVLHFCPLSSFSAPLCCRRCTNPLLVRCRCLKSPHEMQIENTLFYAFLAEIGLSEKETGLVFELNPCLRFADFESVRARVFSLQSAGIQGIELHRLVTKYPELLTAEEIDPFLHFVLNNLQGKIDPAQLRRVLTATEPRFLVGFDKRVRLLLDHGIPQEKIVHVLNNINLTKALCLRTVEEIDSIINFLSRYGGIQIIVKRPKVLNFDLDTQLIPRVQFLKELSGGNEDATGMLLQKLPAILSYSLEHVEGHVDILRSFAGLSDPEIFKIFLVFPNVISASRERKLQPRIEFLKQCGLNSDEIYKFLTKAPLFLALSFEHNLAHKLVFLVKIGYRYRTKEMAMAMGAVTRTSSENLQKVIALFSSYGLCPADIVAMSKKHPPILQYNFESLNEKMEYLIKGMGRDIGELLAFPAFLGYKLDERIKHRYEVKRKSRGEGMSLNKLLSVSTHSFSAEKKKKTHIPDSQFEPGMKVG